MPINNISYIKIEENYINNDIRKNTINNRNKFKLILKMFLKIIP